MAASNRQKSDFGLCFTGAGTFSAVIKTLLGSTTYYARGFIITNNGTTIYGNDITFTTPKAFTGEFTGTLQYFTVPAGVTQITIDARGAQGGDVIDATGIKAQGGNGAQCRGVLNVSPGEIFEILIGGKGGSSSTTSCTGGGGGGTFVVRKSNMSLIMVAGGGGGALVNQGNAYWGRPGEAYSAGGSSYLAPPSTGWGSDVPVAGGTNGAGGVGYYGGGGGTYNSTTIGADQNGGNSAWGRQGNGIVRIYWSDIRSGKLRRRPH